MKCNQGLGNKPSSSINQRQWIDRFEGCVDRYGWIKRDICIDRKILQ